MSYVECFTGRHLYVDSCTVRTNLNSVKLQYRINSILKKTNVHDSYSLFLFLFLFFKKIKTKKQKNITGSNYATNNLFQSSKFQIMIRYTKV